MLFCNLRATLQHVNQKSKRLNNVNVIINKQKHFRANNKNIPKLNL